MRQIPEKIIFVALLGNTMMITAIHAECVDTLRVCGMILGGGVLDGVRGGVGVAGTVMGGVGGILGGAGVQPMQGRDGIIHRDGAGATMRVPGGGCHLLALAPLIVPAATTGHVLTLLPGETRLTHRLGVQQLHLGVRLLVVLMRQPQRFLQDPLMRLLRLIPLALLVLLFKAGARAPGVFVLLLLLAALGLGKLRFLMWQTIQLHSSDYVIPC